MLVWLRVIRVRFLLASVIAVSAGLALARWQDHTIDPLEAALTMAGVAALHASVDLLNDYWDHRRGIDQVTQRTGMSGGTGVLPDGLLEPRSVYRAGIASLALGSAAGAYFVILHGPVIAAILGFAILSIYFYSTKIVDSGLAEVFVAAKGTMIVLGTFFIQSSLITHEAVLAGAAVGVLSSMVLFVTSFPDHAADRSGGRRTLVSCVGRRRASSIFWIFPAISYGILVSCVMYGVFPVQVLAALLAAPLALRSGLRLRRHFDDDAHGLVPAMSDTLMFGRLAGALFVAGLLVSSANLHINSAGAAPPA